MKQKIGECVQISENLKGGAEEMVFSDKPIEKCCRFCSKKMPISHYPEQASQWLKSHEDNCKQNPSNSDNNAKQ